MSDPRGPSSRTRAIRTAAAHATERATRSTDMVTLREYLQEQLDALEAQFDRRVAHLEETFKAYTDAQQRASDKADSTLDHRLETINNTFTQLAASRSELATRDQLDSANASNRALHDAAMAQIETVRAGMVDRINAITASNSSLNGRVTLIIVLVGSLVTIMLFAVGLLINHVITP